MALRPQCAAEVFALRCRVVVEVSLLMVLMILFETARVRLLENTSSIISSTKRTCVVHSPFVWLDHRCHCNCRDLALFAGRLPCCGGVCVAMSCGGGFFTPGGAYDSGWDSVKPKTGIVLHLFPVPRGRLVCMHAELQVQQQLRYLPRQLQLFPVSS